MATNVPPTDLQEFLTFVEQRMDLGLRERSPEECVEEFRAYQQELGRLRALVREGEQASARGESGPLDIEGIMTRVRARLAEEGIADADGSVDD